MNTVTSLWNDTCKLVLSRKYKECHLTQIQNVDTANNIKNI